MMTITKLAAGTLALALAAMPVAASAAATDLSTSASVRAGTATTGKSAATSEGVIGGLLAAGIASIGIIAIVQSDDDSDSN